MRSFFCTLSLTLCLGFCPLWSVASEPVYVLDQRHDLAYAYESWHNIRTYSPAQEFVPGLGGLSAVDIWTLDIGYPQTNGLGATLQAVLREDSADGPTLATSEPLLLPDQWDAPARFLFDDQVPLEQGRRYAIELKILEGDSWAVRSFGELFPAYAPGRYFLSGAPVASSDMWFRTLVHIPQPNLRIDSKRTLRWVGVPPLTYRVWSSSDLSNWTSIGTAQSQTAGYAFTNAPAVSQPVFFRVSYP